MNYGQMLANSIISNDGSSYANNASNALSGALDAARAANEMQNNMIANASFATDSLVKAVGTASTVTKDKDGNVITTPGSGFIGMAESVEDFAGRGFDLQQAINKNTAEYNNITRDIALENQKQQYENELGKLFEQTGISSLDNYQQKLDTELQTFLAQNNSRLDANKVKSYLTNPNLINQALANKEITDDEAVMLHNLTKSNYNQSLQLSNRLKLQEEYNRNGWLTDENLYQLAKIRSDNPFLKSQGLSTIDIYNLLQTEQRAVRNQGDLTNDMFDLNYSVNRNLLNGNRAIGDQLSNLLQSQNNQPNTQSNVNRSNVATSTNNNVPANNVNQNDNNIEQTNADNQSQYISNITLNDNGTVKIELTEEGIAKVKQSQQDISSFVNDILVPESQINATWEGTKKAAKNAALVALPLLSGGGVLVAVSRYGLMPLIRGAVSKGGTLIGIGADALGTSLNWFFNDALEVNGKEASNRFKAELQESQNIRSNYSKEISQAKTQKEKLEIRKKYEGITKDFYNKSSIMVDEQTKKYLDSKGYTKELQEAFKSGDTKKLDEITDKISKDKDFNKIYNRRNDLQTTKKGTAKLYGSKAIGGGIKAALIYSTVFVGGGMIYDNYFSNDKSLSSSNPNETKTYDDLKEKVSSFTQSYEDGNKAWQARNVSHEDGQKNFISADISEELKDIITTDIDYSTIKENINKDYRNGKISQKEAQEQLAYVKKVESAANAIWYEKDIQHERDKADPNSFYNTSLNPVNSKSNEVKDPNNEQARIEMDVKITQATTTINKQLDGGNQNQKDSNEISYNAGVGFSSIVGNNVNEIDIGGGKKVKVSSELSSNDKISNDFISMKDAPKGTVVPVTAWIFKDKFVSHLDNNDLATANFYKDLKDQGIDEKLLQLDTYMQANKQSEAYKLIQKILEMTANTAAKHKPGGIVTKNGSSRVMNKELAELISGGKNYNLNRLNSQLFNDLWTGYRVREMLKKGEITPFVAAHIIGNYDRTKKKMGELKRQEELKQQRKK